MSTKGILKNKYQKISEKKKNYNLNTSGHISRRMDFFFFFFHTKSPYCPKQASLFPLFPACLQTRFAILRIKRCKSSHFSSKLFSSCSNTVEVITFLLKNNMKSKLKIRLSQSCIPAKS